jgi:protein TonB
MPGLNPQLPTDARRRAGGLLFVVLLHALLGFLFLTLAPAITGEKPGELIVFSIAAPDTPRAEPTPEEAAEPTKTEQAPPKPVETPPAPPVEAPPVVLPPPAESTAIEQAPPPPAPAPPAPPKATYGPPDLRPKGPPDSERVEGTGPNGEPLYAAQWYREPYDDELRGFLSTARGPGWGLIACRTVPSYRVEDCVIVGESPRGSGIGQSVLAASWQFLVRPPRVGGREKYGEWVRIRIDYEVIRDGRPQRPR